MERKGLDSIFGVVLAGHRLLTHIEGVLRHPGQRLGEGDDACQGVDLEVHRGCVIPYDLVPDLVESVLEERP